MRCLLTRWSISAEADGSARSPRTQKHLSGCLKCSAFTTQVTQLGKNLRSSESQAPEPIVAMTKVPSPRLPRLVFRIIFAGAAGLAVILLVANLRPNTATKTSPKTHQVAEKGNMQNRIAHHIVKTLSENDDSRRALATHDAHDVQTLAGDARGGLRYVLRVSGLQAIR